MSINAESLFFQQMRKLPRLTQSEEQELARRSVGGDMAAAHHLIISHLRFVHHVARRYGRYGHPLGDLLQEGTVGLIEAVRRFNPDRGVRLSTYAIWWIRASIQDHIVRSRSLVKIGTTATQKAMFFNLRRRLGSLGDLEAISDDIARAVADRFNTSVEEVRRFARRISRPDQSLDAPTTTDGGETWLDNVRETGPNPEERLSLLRESRSAFGALAKGLANLPPRERLIIRHRFFTEPTLSRAALGAKLGLSKERVRQLEVRALAHLKEVVLSVLDPSEPMAALAR